MTFYHLAEDAVGPAVRLVHGRHVRTRLRLAQLRWWWHR